MSYFYDSEMGEPRWGKITVWGVGGLILLVVILMAWPFVSVGTGERGVITVFGQVKGTKAEGLHFINPFTTDLVKMDIKVQKNEVEASAASKDLQTVTTKVAVNYHLSSDSVAKIYQEVGTEYASKIIAPALQEAVKAATAKYTAEELITKRSVVRDEMLLNIREKLTDAGLLIDEFNIVDFDFSTQFNAAIEAKVTAEQRAKEAENKLKQVEFEAQQQIAQAQAEAQAIRLQSDAANNPRYVELKQLEVQAEFAKKWNGQLPQNLYGSAPIPFLQLGN
jgi:prohibitin 2